VGRYKSGKGAFAVCKALQGREAEQAVSVPVAAWPAVGRRGLGPYLTEILNEVFAPFT
jgi:hypothetical protein